jgi:hypothetical protein
MDGLRFDLLTRTFITSRRSTMRTFLGGAMGALIAFRGGEEAAAGCKKVGKKCDKNKDCCDGAKCKGGSNKKKGKCRCTDGLKDCDGTGTCASLAEDDANCGTCGNACAAGEACCDATCIDVESDRANCGGCGAACGDAEVCNSGTCVPCPPAFPRCGDSCCDGEDCNNGTCESCPPGTAPCPPGIPLDCCPVVPI